MSVAAQEQATVPAGVAGQDEGATVAKPEEEVLEDVRALGFMRRWMPSIVTGGGLLVAIISSGVMFAARVATIEAQMEDLRTTGTPRDQGFALRIAALETASVADRAERVKDHELLLKIDRKLSLLICKGDRSKCSE